MFYRPKVAVASEIHINIYHHHHHHHHIFVMEMGHLLTRSGLTIQKSLQRSAMNPSASWRIVFHYPG